MPNSFFYGYILVTFFFISTLFTNQKESEISIKIFETHPLTQFPQTLTDSISPVYGAVVMVKYTGTGVWISSCTLDVSAHPQMFVYVCVRQHIECKQ